MSTKLKTRKNAQAETKPTAKGPVFIAYTVIDRGEDQDGIWRAVGPAWVHRNGEGLNVQLEAFPVNGRLVLLPPREQEKEE